MGAILTFLVGGFGSVFTFFGAKIAAKFGIQLALVGVFVAAALTFSVALAAAGGALVGAMPDIVQDGVGYLPSSLDECVTAIIAGETAAYVYRQIVIVASIKSRI